MKRQSGFMLIMVLLMAVLFVAVGLGYLTSVARNYQAAWSAGAAAQAREFARAGLQDALQKLNKDRDFPPHPSAFPSAVGEVSQPYSYSEDVTDFDGVTVLGSYQVVIDTRYRDSPLQWEINPNCVIVVSSTGYTGARSSPTGQAACRITLDLYNPDQNSTGVAVTRIVQDGVPSHNLNFFHQLRFEDLGSM